MADDPNAVLRLHPVLHLPVLEEVVKDRVKLLLRRVPGLQHVVMNVSFVDGGNGGLGVRVGCEQHAAGLGVQPARLLQELHTCHLRHPVVGEH